MKNPVQKTIAAVCLHRTHVRSSQIAFWYGGSLTVEILADGGFWGMENHFSLQGWPLLDL